MHYENTGVPCVTETLITSRIKQKHSSAKEEEANHDAV